MNTELVLIDTCAWIDFFRYKQGVLGDQVTKLIANDKAAITGIVIAELLQGVKNIHEQRSLNLLLNSVTYLDTSEQDWYTVGMFMQQLRQQGITVPLSDAVIAAIAIRHHAKLLTIDKHFQHFPVVLYIEIAH